jgi:carboxypeptidase Taq
VPATTTRPITEELAELRAAAAELHDLGRIVELLGWDQETMMPARGVSWRGYQQSTLSGILHERLTSPRLGERLSSLAEAAADERSPLSDAERGLIREMRRSRDRAVKLPTRLVRELAEATTQAVATWQRARAESSWASFQPDLTRVIALKREVAEAIGYAGEPYDALLDEYEPGATAAGLSEMFGRLRADTVALLEKIRASGRQVDRSVLEREYPLDRQWQFGETVLGWMGFDFEAGRQDKSTHPFCTAIGPGDVRLTTRLSERDLGQALFGSMHEGGHGLYEQGIGEAVQRTPIGQGVSLGIHESQSRLWENCVGRGRPFWQFALPKLAELFPRQLAGVEVDAFWRAVNLVEPSLIRVEADEVTYNLHIMLRFEVERRLFTREVDVADLPRLWNETMVATLGIEPPNDREGVLQDIHWGFGLVGYFPTYTLGNLYAAQLWATIGRELPERDAAIARGELRPILGWLRERIHQHGGTYPPADLIERATGEPPNPRYLTEYLTAKYGQVYGF